MKAITYEGIEKVAYSTVDDPKIVQPTDVIVKVWVAGLCGSDLHVFHGREQGLDCGTVMGHEFVGEIVETGSEVRLFKEGDVVMNPFSTSCGHCHFCTIGLTCRCVHGQLYGWVEGDEGLHGGQAEYVRVPQADGTLMLMPEAVTPNLGILLGDNLSTGFYCAEQAGVEPSGCYVVLGCGSVGLMTVIAARMMGAEHVFAVDSITSRLEKAASFGAIPLNYKTEDVLATIKEATKGRGADAVMEVVGSSEASRMAVDLVRPGGIVSTVGVHTANTFSFSPVEAYDKNLTFKIGRSPARYYMERLLGKLDQLPKETESVITQEFSLTDGVKAYELFVYGKEDCIKAVLRS